MTRTPEECLQSLTIVVAGFCDDLIKGALKRSSDLAREVGYIRELIDEARETLAERADNERRN